MYYTILKNRDWCVLICTENSKLISQCASFIGNAITMFWFRLFNHVRDVACRWRGNLCPGPCQGEGYPCPGPGRVWRGGSTLSLDPHWGAPPLLPHLARTMERTWDQRPGVPPFKYSYSCVNVPNLFFSYKFCHEVDVVLGGWATEHLQQETLLVSMNLSSQRRNILVFSLFNRQRASNKMGMVL